jgi:hypothetical protein
MEQLIDENLALVKQEMNKKTHFPIQLLSPFFCSLCVKSFFLINSLWQLNRYRNLLIFSLAHHFIFVLASNHGHEIIIIILKLRMHINFASRLIISGWLGVMVSAWVDDGRVNEHFDHFRINRNVSGNFLRVWIIWQFFF